MAKPTRNSDPAAIRAKLRTFFVSTNTIAGQFLLQSERMALLLIDVLRTYTMTGRLRIHEFVVMPNHLHLLLTIDGSHSVEKAVQLIKGNFSYRANKELGFSGEVWQRGFSEVRVFDHESFLQHKRYIDENPVKAGLARSADEYPYCSAFLRKQKQQRLKPKE